MPTPEEIKAAEEAAAKAAEEAKAKEAEEARAAGITTDAGKEALRKEREAKRAAEKAAKEASDELAALKAEKAEADAAKAKADQAEALKRGEHEKVIETTTAENATLKAELDAVKKKLAAIDAANKARIEAGVKDIPDDLKQFDPGPDAPLDQRLTWFEKAQAVAASRQGSGLPRVPSAPRPDAEKTKNQVVTDEMAQLRKRYGVRR